MNLFRTQYLQSFTDAQLATMQTEWLACISALAMNQSYSISGRSFSRVNLVEAAEFLGAVNREIDSRAGNFQKLTYADMSR